MSASVLRAKIFTAICFGASLSPLSMLLASANMSASVQGCKSAIWESEFLVSQKSNAGR